MPVQIFKEDRESIMRSLQLHSEEDKFNFSRVLNVYTTLYQGPITLISLTHENVEGIKARECIIASFCQVTFIYFTFQICFFKFLLLLLFI